MLADDNVVCPIDGTPLQPVGDELVSQSGREYKISGGIPLLYVDEDHAPLSSVTSQGTEDAVTHKVQNFYEDVPGFCALNRSSSALKLPPLDRTLAEIGMLLSHFGGEGGLFLCVGRKEPD